MITSEKFPEGRCACKWTCDVKSGLWVLTVPHHVCPMVEHRAI